jgi:hypothetical protein
MNTTQFRPDYFFKFSIEQRPEFFSNFGWPDYLFYLQKTARPPLAEIMPLKDIYGG